MSTIDREYEARMDALSVKERVARSMTMLKCAVAKEGMFQLLDGVEALKLDIRADSGELDRSELLKVLRESDCRLPVELTRPRQS